MEEGAIVRRLTLPWRRNRAPRNPVLYQVGTAFENGPGDDNVDWTARGLYLGIMTALTLIGLGLGAIFSPFLAIAKLREMRCNRRTQKSGDQNDS